MSQRTWICFRLNDCLIAAIALDHGASLLHADRDFDVIAHVTGLSSDS
jgi:predicted nucleic acid-binding protein